MGVRMLLYYFTGALFALSNLALRRIKIARYEDLNDPFELETVDVDDEVHRLALRETKKELNKNNGLICFSKSWSNPVLWGHYAEKYTGMCLGFDVTDKLLMPAIYKTRPPKMEIDPGTGKLTEKSMKRLLRTKFSDWKYEDEMRFFVELDHSTVESGKYFSPFSRDLVLREVILGPRCELPLESVRNIVADFEPPVDVLRSIIATDRFEVVKE